MGDGEVPGRLTRRAVLAALLGSAAGAAFATAPEKSMRPPPRDPELSRRAMKPLDQLIAEIGLTGQVGFMVADARTGEVLEAKNPLLALPPASVTKAVTALYALDALGPAHRFTTRLVATGPVVNGVIQGDLALVGGGDPGLDTDALGDMARQLKDGGVHGLTGGFKVCATALPSIPAIDPAQPPHVGYNPSVSGLNLNYNRVHFEWKREAGDYTVSMDARARKYSPRVDIARMRVVDRSMPVYTYSDAGGADEWTVARPALGQGGSRWLPVRKPEAYAAEVFRTLARTHGIDLPKPDFEAGTPDGEVRVERRSETLKDILRGMLKWSTNLTAEVAGLSASVARGRAPDTLEASAERMSLWARETLGARHAALVDHSGLSDRSRLSARAMVTALSEAREQGMLPGLMKEIPMRNDRGEVLPDHPIRIRAKTGTLNFVSALAGYISAPGGRELVFAYFSADLDQRAAIREEDGEIPDGARTWKARSRLLQLKLVERWGTAFSA
ncbi:D-alanyl-D-alanine carboxypeptidase/D-alanyl-D-alanine-endopeptidase [Psychromarinibacter sp. C21-152]|uniref:D-alanyl-D-alanine carboxypeptidase/D-alanyl-D-alanine-endopeptidase n=1 Tax=Psychromarinibacter sediminicola TaxID=3033385 RepID=A0AAE3NWS4_9RHOB|nr:D-alanyl-D-alanine carboxypeptidase/D-alanyl-D-alanine-endopeptidase [Psychromarinibacter sediminicola]MDF0603506.1 D-alanyl-D-alanine carboxypeptidase/D-alanyl-D-alanine-endopeptidase [Psychromarinibacter sediminicola]